MQYTLRKFTDIPFLTFPVRYSTLYLRQVDLRSVIPAQFCMYQLRVSNEKGRSYQQQYPIQVSIIIYLLHASLTVKFYFLYSFIVLR
jgi:hypothetical protein